MHLCKNREYHFLVIHIIRKSANLLNLDDIPIKMAAVIHSSQLREAKPIMNIGEFP